MYYTKNTSYVDGSKVNLEYTISTVTFNSILIDKSNIAFIEPIPFIFMYDFSEKKIYFYNILLDITSGLDSTSDVDFNIMLDDINKKLISLYHSVVLNTENLTESQINIRNNYLKYINGE